MQFSRREWLAAAASVPAAGCRRQRRSPSTYGYRGFAFVANSEGKAVAAVDLNAFAVVRHIALEADPIQMVNDPVRPFVFAVTPASGEIVEISAAKLEVSRRVRLGGGTQPSYAKISADGRFLWVLCRAARQLIRVPVDRFQPDLRIPLPAEPADFDLGPAEERSRDRLAVSVGSQVAIFDGVSGKPVATIPVDGGGEAGGIVFRKDGRQILFANRTARQLTIVDLASGRTLASLPLAVRPDRLCAKDDGGQVFINGEGMDAVVTVYPYQSEVGNTMLAGRSPGAMAVSAAWDYLLVANPASNDVTIVNIANQRVLAVAQVGKRPEFIAVTPDGNYALVLNRESGDIAVLHLVIEPRRSRAAAIAARIPVGSGPVGAVIRSF
jgi:YVTN family beta-propeller protein